MARPMPTEAPGRRDQRRVDADHIAIEIEHRAAAVAHVDGRVGLNVAIVGAIAGDPAMKRRDDAGGDGASDAVRVADCDHPVADARPRTVAPAHERQVRGVDLQEREVGGVVAADDARRIFLAVAQRDGDGVDCPGAGQALDEMVVGDDVAVRRNDEAGAERAGLAGTLRCCRPIRCCCRRRPACPAAALGSNWRKNCSNGSCSAPCTGTRCLVEMLTTAGCSLATRSAKDIGAPARGASADVPGPFCAT